MNRHLKYCLLIFLIICALVGNAQRLVVGDTLPDHVIANSIGLKEKNLRDFKGKLTLLIFWRIKCRTCVLGFFTAQALQHHFGPKIQIVMVNTADSRAEIEQLLDDWRKASFPPMTLPQIYGDPVLSAELFTPGLFPHVAWIDEAGRVMSITSSVPVNDYNIQQILDGHFPEMRQVTVPAPEKRIDPTLPLYVNDNGDGERGIQFRSYLGKFDAGLRMLQGMIADHTGFCSIRSANSSILTLYRYAHSDRIVDSVLYPMPLTEVILKGTEGAAYTADSHEGVRKEYLYVYELYTPPMPMPALQAIMRADLDRYFGLKVSWQKMKKQCLVLSTIDSARYAYRGGPRRMLIDPTYMEVNGIPMAEFILFMKECVGWGLYNYPFRDETRFTGRLGDIRFEGDMKNYAMVGEKLKPYGLKLSIEERELEMLVLEEPESPPAHADQP